MKSYARRHAIMLAIVAWWPFILMIVAILLVRLGVIHPENWLPTRR